MLCVSCECGYECGSVWVSVSLLCESVSLRACLSVSDFNWVCQAGDGLVFIGERERYDKRTTIFTINRTTGKIKRLITY